MKTVSIKWATQHGTAQIYGGGVEMALCSKKGEQIGPFVYCKDFFQDAIKGFLNKTSSSIYGYSYNPSSQPPIDLDNIRILLRNKTDKSFLTNAKGVLDLLNQVEMKMKLQLTTMAVCDNPPNESGVVLLVGDGTWLRSPASLSMYTLLSRNGLVHEPGVPFMKTIDGIISGKMKGGQSHDGTFLQYSKPGMELILDLGINKVFGKDIKENYKSSVPTNIIHHYGGCVAFGSRHQQAVKQWPNWKFPEKALNAPGICFS